MSELIVAWVSAFAFGGSLGLVSRWLRTLVADEQARERG